MIKIQKNGLNVLKLLPIFILLGSFTSFSDKALAGSFAKTCDGITLKKGVKGSYINVKGIELITKCRTSTGDSRESRIDLNNFITTVNGYMAFTGGSSNALTRTCRNVRLSKNRRTLLATCQTSSGDFRNSSLNLNNRITNRNGILRFDMKTYHRNIQKSISSGGKGLAKDFTRTCDGMILSGVAGADLIARCRTLTDEAIDTRIDLNDFIRNVNGHLTFTNTKGSFFTKTCRNIRLSRTRRTLFASCPTSSGAFRNSSLRIDSRITNRNGVLKYEVPHRSRTRS